MPPSRLLPSSSPKLPALVTIGSPGRIPPASVPQGMAGSTSPPSQIASASSRAQTAPATSPPVRIIASKRSRMRGSVAMAANACAISSPGSQELGVSQVVSVNERPSSKARVIRSMARSVTEDRDVRDEVEPQRLDAGSFQRRHLSRRCRMPAPATVSTVFAGRSRPAVGVLHRVRPGIGRAASRTPPNPPAGACRRRRRPRPGQPDRSPSRRRTPRSDAPYARWPNAPHRLPHARFPDPSCVQDRRAIPAARRPTR